MEKISNNKFLNNIGAALNAHGSTIAMIGSMVSFGCAFYMAFRASKNVSDAKEKFTQEKEKVASEGLEMPVEKEKMRELRTSRNIRYILAYRWVALFGGLGYFMMILAKMADFRTIGSLTALAATQRDKLEKFAENAKDMIGEEKFKTLENKTLEDMVLENFIGEDGPVCFIPRKYDGVIIVDELHGRWFQSDEMQITNALVNAEKDCKRLGRLAEDKFYEDYLGLEAPKGACREWTAERPFKAHLSREEYPSLKASMLTIKFDIKPIEHTQKSVKDELRGIFKKGD